MPQVDINQLAQSKEYDVTISVAPAENPDVVRARILRENSRFFAALAIVVIGAIILAFALGVSGDEDTKSWAKTILNTIIGGAIAIALGARTSRSD